MFEKVSVAITKVLEDKKIIQSSTKEVCAYGLRQIFSTILNAGTMLLIGFLMQMLIEAILFTVIYIPVRVYAGGYHASTPQRCWAFSAIMLWIDNVMDCIVYRKIHAPNVFLGDYNIVVDRLHRCFFAVAGRRSK